MWFKKKFVLKAEGNYSTEKSADNTTDLRTTPKNYTNSSSSINSGLPSAADAGNYFFLPALGYYASGQLRGVGDFGFYWSSNAYPWSSSDLACDLAFDSGHVYVGNGKRFYGMRVGGFE